MTKPSQIDLFDAGSAVDRVRSWAILDAELRYRYRLWRVWEPELPRWVWVMLNPSTADAQEDDATIRSCRRITAHHGGGALDVVNLFAFRATQPKDLVAADRGSTSIIGPDNDRHILEAISGSGKVIVAWGAEKIAATRSVDVLRMLHARGAVHCLGLTKGGAPRHPLYARHDATLIELPGMTRRS